MQALKEKAKRIRLLILDVDGVLTSGLLYYGNQDIELKAFHVHDGLGIKLLQKADISVAVISSKKSKAVIQRLKELKINHYYLGQDNKRLAYDDLKNKLSLTDDEIAYVGDDLPDLPVLNTVGFSIAVQNAVPMVKEKVDYVTTQLGGNGAVREVCEFILHAQNRHGDMLEMYTAKHDL